MLKDEIIPQLKKEVPGQPFEEELKADKYKNRFVTIFNREGYSPGKNLGKITEIFDP